MSAVVPLLAAAAWPRPWRQALLRGMVSTAGVFTTAGVIIGSDVMLGGQLIRSYRTFGAMVSQGEYQEGWRLPFEYLWHAEHGLLIVWLAGLGWCLVTVRHWSASPVVRVGLTGSLAVWAALAVTSTAVHVFVVYGRLARQLVPFFCLLAACMLGRVWMSQRRVVRALVPATLVVLAAQSVANFQQPLKQTFPDDLERKYGPSHESDLIWVNVEHIYPEPRKIVLGSDVVLIHQAPHPLEFLPYQYRGLYAGAAPHTPIDGHPDANSRQASHSVACVRSGVDGVRNHAMRRLASQGASEPPGSRCRGHRS